jgi:hypothetical protein
MSYMNAIPSPVSSVFESLEPAQRDILLQARTLIFEVAREDEHIGEIEETLRWGEPAYITCKKKTGSTIRLAIEKQRGQPAIFFNARAFWCRAVIFKEPRDFAAKARRDRRDSSQVRNWCCTDLSFA